MKATITESPTSVFRLIGIAIITLNLAGLLLVLLHRDFAQWGMAIPVLLAFAAVSSRVAWLAAKDRTGTRYKLQEGKTYPISIGVFAAAGAAYAAVFSVERSEPSFFGMFLVVFAMALAGFFVRVPADDPAGI